jgi:hypothetical protein
MVGEHGEVVTTDRQLRELECEADAISALLDSVGVPSASLVTRVGLLLGWKDMSSASREMWAMFERTSDILTAAGVPMELFDCQNNPDMRRTLSQDERVALLVAKLQEKP